LSQTDVDSLLKEESLGMGYCLLSAFMFAEAYVANCLPQDSICFSRTIMSLIMSSMGALETLEARAPFSSSSSASSSPKTKSSNAFQKINQIHPHLPQIPLPQAPQACHCLTGRIQSKEGPQGEEIEGKAARNAGLGELEARS